jgi:hypothetical protein
MMNNSEQKTERRKKVYEPPKLRRVELRPEEAVLGNCKVSGVSGPGNAGTCTLVTSCSTVGT